MTNLDRFINIMDKIFAQLQKGKINQMETYAKVLAAHLEHPTVAIDKQHLEVASWSKPYSDGSRHATLRLDK